MKNKIMRVVIYEVLSQKKTLRMLFSLIIYSSCLNAQTIKYHVSATNFGKFSNEGACQAPFPIPGPGSEIRISDFSNNILANNTGNYEFNVPLKKYFVALGSCRRDIDPFLGVATLLTYEFNVPSGIDSFYEVKRYSGGSLSGELLGSLFYEKVDTNILNEINCRGLSLNVIPDVKPSDVLEWQYSFEGNLQTIASSQSKLSVNIDFNNFSVNFSEKIGKTIFFRYKLLGNVFSPLKAYTIVACSPELIKPVITNPITCGYSRDGEFTLNFKRDLNDNETLVITLYDSDDESVLFNQEFIDTLINNGDGTFGYTWQALLDAGNYKVKFQTHNDNNGIDTDDASWDSLEFSDSFTISKPDKVSFSITNISDKTCFNTNDGYIDVNATGESDRTFLYQLTKEQVVQFYNGTNWVDYSGTKANDETWFPFISKNNTKIGNLAKGNYRVKVKDSKGCFAR